MADEKRCKAKFTGANGTHSKKKNEIASEVLACPVQYGPLKVGSRLD